MIRRHDGGGCTPGVVSEGAGGVPRGQDHGHVVFLERWSRILCSHPPLQTWADWLPWSGSWWLAWVSVVNCVCLTMLMCSVVTNLLSIHPQPAANGGDETTLAAVFRVLMTYWQCLRDENVYQGRHFCCNGGHSLDFIVVFLLLTRLENVVVSGEND